MNDDMTRRGPSMSGTTFSVSGSTTIDSSQLICECYGTGPETIEIEQVLAAEMRQKVVEIELRVPEEKPKIKQIVDVYVKHVKLHTIDVIPNKVVVRGEMEIKIMYVADLPDEPVHAIEKKHVKFTRDIDVEGAMPGMKATADCTVEYVDYDFDECDPCKAHVTVVLKIWTRVTTTTEMDVYALSPVDQAGTFENMTASASVESMANASQLSGMQTAKSQMSGEKFMPPYEAPPMEMPEENVTVTTPETTAGANLSISGAVGKVTGNRVNVRTGPGTNYPSLTKLSRGDVVTIKEQAFGWYKIVLPDGSSTGWIASWFVNLED